MRKAGLWDGGLLKGKSGWIDAALFVILAGGCLLLFGQQDINVTGDRSFLFFEHGFFDFYDASYAATGGYGANYMPSTFWLYAVWNIIPWLFGARPVGIGRSPHMLLTLWYKILPCLFYLGCGLLMFAILKQLGCGEKKARLGMYLFLTSPLAMFSQFVFSQYDSFVVFFTLLGILFYLKNKDWAFILCMGFAATFKYYALAILVIFLFLKEKRVGRLLCKLGAGLIPLMIEIACYLPSEAFRKSVFGFTALTYTSKLGLDVGIAVIQIVPFIALLLCAWAYFVKPKTIQERFLWAIYLSLGICFVLFGLSSFHPQWLLFAVPFWVFGLLLYEKQPIFYWLDILAMAVLTVLIANIWQGNIDSVMFRSGILQPFVYYRSEYAYRTLLDFLPFKDANLLYTMFSALLLLMFLRRHPRFYSGKITAPPQCRAALLRTRALSVLLLVAPLLLCLPSILRSPEILYETRSSYAEGAVTATAQQPIKVFLNVEEDCIIDQLGFQIQDSSEDAPVHMKIYDSSGRAVMDTTAVLSKNRYCYIPFPSPMTAVANESYRVELYSEEGFFQAATVPFKANTISRAGTTCTNYYDPSTGAEQKLWVSVCGSPCG